MTGTLPPWRKDAACKDTPKGVFYPECERGETTASPRIRTLNALAKAICATCPVINECQDWAFNRPEVTGTWGGLTDSERRRINGTDRDSRRRAIRLIECGTNQGYNKHRMGHNKPCGPCQRAHDDYMAEWARNRQATA